MGGPFKKLLYIIPGIAALLVIAAIFVFLFFDPNDYRDRIAEDVKRQTGRDLVIEGDLELSFFPWLAVTVGKTTLGNAKGFDDEPFLSFQEARLSIEMIPLIVGDGVKVGAVVLDGFQLNLVDAGERNNWQDMVERTEREAQPEQVRQKQDIELSIASIEITNAAVSYRDEKAREQYGLTDFNLITGPVGGGDPIDIHSSFDYELQPADVLGRIIFDGNVDIQDDAISMTDVELVVDDSTFAGELSVARNEAGTISIDLSGDSINLDRYMESTASSGSAGGDAAPIEIPVDLIRALNVSGKLTLDDAQLSGMDFQNVELGLNVANGDLRLRPITADFFSGKYQGDVRINAAGATPVLSVNENINNVSLGALAQAMFDQQNITGTINGSFKLSGSGENLAAIQRSLGGSISMELLDGAWEGTDVWYELRRARALYKQEPAPEPELPARTQFSNVTATGPVRDGVFRNDDLFAELPFMQLTGKGKVDFAAGEVNYRMTARVLEQPEFIEGATEEELEEFTEAVIPLRITGSLVDPTVTPDVEEMLKDEVREKVEEEIKDKLLKKLFGDDE